MQWAAWPLLGVLQSKQHAWRNVPENTEHSPDFGTGHADIVKGLIPALKQDTL